AGWSTSLQTSLAAYDTVTTVPDVTTAGTVTGTVAVGNGGTGATTAAGAQANLGVPSTTGSGASGTWGINITGNAATATSATTAGGAPPTGAAGGALSGSYPNPGLANNAIYPVTAGDGNGLRFWGGSASYSVSMGNNGTTNHYGPGTDYPTATNLA